MAFVFYVFAMKILFRSVAYVVAALLVLSATLGLGALASYASTSVSYNFNSPNDLSTGFNSYISSGSVSQSVNGGIGDSGAINAPSSANAVFASKASYSIGPVGSKYTFTSFMKSVGNSGYSGMGFTSLLPTNSNASGDPYRPRDALGISVHGGGFIFHNGVSNIYGNWNGVGNPASITNVKTGLWDLLNSGSSDSWYKVILQITRDSSSTFDMRVEVWPSSSTGQLLNNEASAIFELNNQTNTDLISSPSISSYINFSGYRVTHFDNYSVELEGGSTVIQAGSPVVLTVAVSDTQNVVTVDGNVTATGGAAVNEKGFVYSTSPNPTISDNKVVVGSGTGTFAGITNSLPAGTYYFRTFATNASGTSYGAEEEIILLGSVSPSSSPNNQVPSVASGSSSTVSALAETGTETSGFIVAIAMSMVAVVTGVFMFRKSKQKA